MKKEIQYEGYSTEPSDYEVADGQLATSLNLINEDGQLKPVFQPAEKFSLLSGEKLLWIHRMTGHTHYILLYTTTVGGTTTQTLKWTCEQDDVSTSGTPPVETRERHTIDGFTVTGTPTVNSIGNTLIVNDDTGINYFLWSTEGTAHYEALGQKPPMLEITFGLHSDFAVWPNIENTGDDENQYRGVAIEVGNVTDGLLPKLGEDGRDQWAKPKDEYTESEENYFKTKGTTYSIEGITGNTEKEQSELLKIKNMLSSSVFATLNKFVNENGTNDNKFVLPFFKEFVLENYS